MQRQVRSEDDAGDVDEIRGTSGHFAKECRLKGKGEGDGKRKGKSKAGK